MRNDAARRGRLGRIGWLPTALVSVALLAACGGGSSGTAASTPAGSGSAQPSASPAGAKKITFWLSASDAQAAGYKTLAKDFEAKTGTAVEIVNVPYDGFQDKLKQAAQANALPDVGSVPALDPLWIEKLQDLKSISGNADYKIIKSVVSTASDGKVLTIPSDVTAAGMYLNKSLFDKAGVAYPTDPNKAWTWDEFLAATAKVKAATGAKYQMVYDHSAARIRSFIYTNGGKGWQLGADGKFATDPGTVAALTKFAALNDDKVMPKSVWTSNGDPSALFKSGQVVAYYSGVWQVADFAQSITAFKWVSAPTPAQPVHATDINLGGNVVAFNNDGTASSAKAFVDFLFQPANYSKVASENGYLPVETGLTLTYQFKQQEALDAFALYNKEIELADPVSASGNANFTKLLLAGKNVENDPTKDEMTKLINGEQNAQKTADNIIAGLNQQIG